MGESMMEILLMIIKKDMEFINGMRLKNMKGNGRIINNMEKDIILIHKGLSEKGFGKMGSELNGLMKRQMIMIKIN